MFVYLLRTTLWLALFYAGYRWHLRRRTDESTRADYLLAALLLGFLIPALPELDHLWTLPELRGADEPLPEWRFTLFDAVLVVYFLGAAAFLLQTADRIRRLWKWLRATPLLHSDHYNFVDPHGVPAADLLHVLFHHPEQYSEGLRVVTHYERDRLRWTHFVRVLGWEILRALCWLQPWTHWYHAERTRLARRNVHRYLRAKTQRLDGLLSASSDLTLRFAWVVPGWIAPVKITPHARPRTLLLGWLAGLLIIGTGLEVLGDQRMLPGTKVVAETDRVLRLMGRTPIYVQRSNRPQEDFIFYWGSWLTVNLAPDGSQHPDWEWDGPEWNFITKEKLLQSLRDEPLLATETGPLFNRVEFDLNYWDGTGWTMCHVLADAAQPNAYAENTCLKKFADQIQPGQAIRVENVRHGFAHIPNNVPDFTLFVRFEQDWTTPGGVRNSRWFEWRDQSGYFTYHPLNGHWTTETREIPLDRLRELVRGGFLRWAYNIDVQLDRTIEHEGRRMRGDYFEMWEGDNPVWDYVEIGDRVRIAFQDDFGREFVLEILVR